MPFTMDIVRGNPGEKIDRSQQRALGEDVLDTLGRVWSYVRFDDQATFGELYRDSVGLDVVGATRTVSSAVAVGSTDLIDTGNFPAAAAEKLIGAYGMITAGGGVGQTFAVVDRVKDNNDTLIVKVLSGRTAAPTGDGWVTALTTASEYDFVIPGLASLAGMNSVLPRGFVQQDITASEIDKYGYVLKRGPGFAVLDVSGAAAVSGGFLVPVGGGLVAGPSADNANGHLKVARSILGDVATGSSDARIAINAEIDNDLISLDLVSYAHPIDRFLDIN